MLDRNVGDKVAKPRKLLTLLMLFAMVVFSFNIGCSTGGSKDTPSSCNCPAIATFAVTPTTQQEGDPFSLLAFFTHGNGIITPGNLSITSGTPLSIPAQVGVTAFTLTVQEPGTSNSAVMTVPVTVIPFTGSLTFTQPSATAGTSDPAVVALPAGATATIPGVPGTVTNGQTVAVPAAIVAGTQNVVMTVTTATGQVVPVASSFVVVPPPVITTFVASPNPQIAGGSATLVPTFTGGVGTIDNGIGTVTSGGGYPSPPLPASTTFTLTVTNALGATVSQPVTANIQPAPVITSLTAVPTVPLYGGTVALTGVFSGGTGAVNQGVGSIASGIPLTTPAITAPTTYVLTVSDSFGLNATSQMVITPATVTVAPVLPAGSIINKNQIQPFQSSVSGAANPGLVWQVNGITGGNATVGTISQTGVYTAPATTGTYTIQALSVAKPSVAQTTTVNVNSTMTANISATTTTPIFGLTTVAITPSFTGTSSAVIGTTQGGNDISGAATSGASIPVQPTGFVAARTYWLRVTNGAGAYVDTSVTVTPQTVNVATISPANASRPGNTVGVVFTSGVTGALNPALTWAVSAGTITAGQGTASITWTAPPTAGSVTVTATSAADPTKSVFTTVTVTGASSASIEASWTNPALGATNVTITPTYTGTASAMVGTSQGGNDISATPVSGIAIPVQASGFLTAKTYWIRATDGTGAFVDNSVTVTPQVVTVAAITPAGPIKDVNTPGVTFSSFTTGAFNKGLTWNTSAGTITAGQGTNTITWTAPATAGNVTVTATSMADPTKSASTTVTVAAAATATLAASTTTPAYGSTTVSITPTFTGVAAKVGSSQGASDIAATPTSGVPIPVQASGFVATKTFWLRATDATGAYVDSTVTVTPQTVVVAAITPATPTKLTSTAGVAFSSNVTGAVNTGLTWTVSAGSITAGQGTATISWTAPSTAGNVEVTATSTANPSESASTLVTVAPRATDTITASITNPAYGAINVVLIPVFTGASAVLGTTLGGNDISSAPVSGAPITVQPSGFKTSKTYYIRATDALGGTSDASIAIAVQTVAVGTIAPASPTVTPNSTTTFTVPVTGGSLNTVTWTATSGTIDPTTGVWSAPSSPGSAIITATSIDDPTKSATTTVTVAIAPTRFAITSFASTLSPAGNVTFAPDVIQVPYGQSATLAWTLSLPNPATLSLSAVSQGYGSAPYGSQTQGASSVASLSATVNPIERSTFTLTGTGSDGSSSTKTTIVVARGLDWLGGGAPVNAAPPFYSVLNTPTGMAYDGTTGNYYVADPQSNTIRMLTSVGGNWEMSTFAGTPWDAGYMDGYAQGQALFSNPVGIACDTAGNVYVADTGNNLIRMITPGGIVSTFAGNVVGGMGIPGWSEGSASDGWSTIQFTSPEGIAVDTSGNVYVADTGNSQVRILPAGGSSSSYVGSEFGGYSSPTSVACDNNGDAYVCDPGDQIIAVISGGASSIYAGQMDNAGSQDSTDGTGLTATFNNPTGIALDSQGIIWVVDSGNQTIRMVAPGTSPTMAGAVTYYAGGTGTPGYADAFLPSALFNFSSNIQVPSGIAVDPSDNLMVADTNNVVIRYVWYNASTNTVAGTQGVTDNFGRPGNVLLSSNPGGVACDPAGNSYIADAGNNQIWVVNPSGAITVLAGSGQPGSGDGVGAGASFNAPAGIAWFNNYVYVADTGSNTIRRVDASGNVLTVAGKANTTGHANGDSLAQATFNAPNAIASDGTGKLYISDSQNHTIRLFNSTTGQVSLFAGQVGLQAAPGITGNGLTTAAFGTLSGLACDQAGYIYAADSYNNNLWKISPGGWVMKFGVQTNGNPWGFNQSPQGIACDTHGNIYVTDTGGQIDLFNAMGVGLDLAGNAGTGNPSTAGILYDGLSSAPIGCGWIENPIGIGITNMGDAVVTVPQGIMVITAPLPCNPL